MSSFLEAQPSQRAQNRQLLLKLVVIALVMLGFAYSLIPIYRQLCEVLGINATREVSSDKNTQIDFDRTVKVELISNRVGGLPWRFEAVDKFVTLNPGQLVEARYKVTNTLDREIVAQAKPHVAPETAAKYLIKTQCFCFENQKFKPGETRELLVIFRFTKDLPKDIPVISLSYTFFDVNISQNIAQSAAPTINDLKQLKLSVVNGV